MVVYKITNKINGMIYIGQTIQPLEDRIYDHFKLYSTCTYLSNAVSKYGKESFSVMIIGTYSNLEDLNLAEEYFISWYNTVVPNGYNLKSGGNNGGKLHEESKTKISIANTGKTHTDETRIKMSKSHTGKVLSEETKAKCSLAKMGNKPSEETIKKLSLAATGRKASAETKAKMSISRKKIGGIPHSEESKKKISIANTGKKASEETRAKQSASRKGKLHSGESKKKMSALASGENNPMFGKPSPNKGKKLGKDGKFRFLKDSNKE